MSQSTAETDQLPTFEVTAASDSPTKTSIETRGFEFVIDEPETLGGTDVAPNPVEYLIGAWAGCLNVVCHVVAGELGFEIDELSIEIAGDLDPRTFLGESTESRAGYREIRATIDVQSTATEETLSTWLQRIEERCPITDNLANPTPIAVSLNDQ